MLFPRAKEEQYFDGTYAFTGYDPKDLLAFYHKLTQDKSVTIKTDPALEEEAYTLCVGESGITITAACDCGIFRAAATLKQLVVNHGGALPYCRIEDAPLFKKRAYMLDISRCRMPKVSTITRLIDMLADLKYNEFQLYMESFVFKYASYPQVTADFDCLTPEDIEYLDQYCADRFIDLVPNQNSFGHMGSWLEREEFKHLAVTDGKSPSATVNPLLPETFEFLDNLYGSLLPHFRSKYVNIGLDEAYGLGKHQLEEVCKEKGADNVFMDWLCKLSDHIQKKYHKKVQFWADMVYQYPNSYTRVPEGAVALNWGYGEDSNRWMGKRCRDLQQKGIPYYVCPGNQTWLSFTGKHDLMSQNLVTCGEMGKEYGAIGYMLTDWGCGEGHMHFPVWSLIGAVMAGQIAWNGANQDPRHYTRYAEKYLDDNVFGAPVSNWIRKIQQYYMLEPERIPTSTMTCFTFQKPLSETAAFCFDLDISGEPFYFENIIYYVKRCIEGVSKVTFDENWKRQILVNANMVVLSAELCLIRMTKTATAEKIDELTAMIDQISAEYILLWDRENYPKGKEHFLSQLADRKADLLQMKNA